MTTTSPATATPATAVVSISLAAAGLLTALIPILGALLGLAGATLGHVTLATIKRDGRPAGRGLAIAGITIGYIAAVIGVGFVILVRTAG